jgi:predicted HicB family RNase H-like nuclease
VLVRAPAALKRALVRETARRGISLNDVAVGHLADAFGLEYEPTGRRSGLPGASPVVLLRMPPALKQAVHDEAARAGEHANDVIVRVLAERLGIPSTTNGRKETMASTNGSSNGSSRQQEKVRVAIIGVGNCANSLLQGVEYYKEAPAETFVPGLMHVDLGGYHISDIEFTAAFDVVKGKASTSPRSSRRRRARPQTSSGS